jgi:hypothetical protein
MVREGSAERRAAARLRTKGLSMEAWLRKTEGMAL